MKVLDAPATAAALDWSPLLDAIEATIRDANEGRASCPPRLSVPLANDAAWLLMPSVSRRADIAACKLVTVHPGNRRHGLPAVQGDVIVMRASTGERLALLDGPEVTARRTAVVSALAIRRICAARSRHMLDAGHGAGLQADRIHPAPATCLIIGCGVQGRSHLEALAVFFPGMQFLLASRTPASAAALAAHAANLRLAARVVADAEEVVGEVDLVVCCTDASDVCLRMPPRTGAIVVAIGSFKPDMSELGPAVMQAIGRNILLDSADAGHEAGELAQAGVDPEGLPDLLTWTDRSLPDVERTVLFKSCGNGLWDLAAAAAAVGA